MLPCIVSSIYCIAVLCIELVSIKLHCHMQSVVSLMLSLLTWLDLLDSFHNSYSIAICFTVSQCIALH